MLKPPVPPIPGMTDTLEFVKNLWGGMNVPGVGMPNMAEATLSTDALDKKIADLRAVEAWLNMNTSMLRATIQALEVQRGTLGALTSMSETVSQAMSHASEQAAAAAAFNPFMAAAAAPAAGSSAAGKTAAGSHAGAQGGTQGGAQGGGTSGGGMPQMPLGMPGLPAAMAWWNMLQDQFTQAVTSAMSAGAAAVKPEHTETPKDGGAKG